MKRTLIMLLITTSLGSVIGCAKHKSRPADIPAPPIGRDGSGAVPGLPGGGSGPIQSTSGDNEAELILEGGSPEARRLRLSDFFFKEPVNNPTNIRLAVSLRPSGAAPGDRRYGGEVMISFQDNGRQRAARLSTRHPHNSGISDVDPNRWFNWEGKTVFHGFFQDQFGAIVIVIDEAISLGDGRPAQLVAGRVFFQNFGQVIPPQGPQRMCWQMEIGPYDCRTFMVGGKVKTDSALYPNNYGNESYPPRQPYQLLGSFGGLLRSAAFGD